MQSSGTVTKVVTRKTAHGSRFASVTLDGKSTFKYLLLGTAPTKGQRVTITGVPMVGNPRVNVGGVRVKVEA